MRLALLTGVSACAVLILWMATRSAPSAPTNAASVDAGTDGRAPASQSPSQASPTRLAVSQPSPGRQSEDTEVVQRTRLSELRRTARAQRESHETLGALPSAEILRVREALYALVLEQLEAANSLSLSLPDVPTIEEYRKYMEAWAAYHRAVAAQITFGEGVYECVDMRFMRSPRPGKAGTDSIGMTGYILDSNGSRRHVMIFVDIDRERLPQVAQFSESVTSVLMAENKQKAQEFNALDPEERARRIQAHVGAQEAVREVFREPPSAERDKRLAEHSSRLISSQFRIDTASNMIFPRLSR